MWPGIMWLGLLGKGVSPAAACKAAWYTGRGAGTHACPTGSWLGWCSRSQDRRRVPPVCPGDSEGLVGVSWLPAGTGAQDKPPGRETFRPA